MASSTLRIPRGPEQTRGQNSDSLIPLRIRPVVSPLTPVTGEVRLGIVQQLLISRVTNKRGYQT